MTGSSRRSPALPRLHLVTDDRVLAERDFVERARSLLDACGADVALHVRGPGTGGRRLHDIARALTGGRAGDHAAQFAAAGRERALLLVNDRVDVALLVGADGAQLGARSMPPSAARRILGDRLIGRSVHAAGAADRESEADFLVFGTVFESASHPGREGVGPDALSEAVRAEVRRAEAAAGASIRPRPLLAIGGVTPARVPAVLAAGAWGVAVLGGVWHAPDPARAAGEYLRALDRSAR